jgi:HEAT repeat protein
MDRFEPVRFEAWEAVGAIGGREHLPTVIRHLQAAVDDRTRQIAERTLLAIVRRERANASTPILAGLKGSHAESRIVLLRCLVLVADAKSLEAVRAATHDPKPEVAQAATRVLTDWPALEATADLLVLAHGNDPIWRALALRGYVRLCRDGPMPPAEKLRMIAEAMKLAANQDDKRLVIAALADIHDPAALKLVLPCFETPELTEEAAVAAVRIADSLDAKHRTDAAPILQRVIKSSKQQDLQLQARRILDRLGLKPD